MRVEEMLRVLVEGTREEMAAALDARVRFRQGDGTVHVGREAVLEMFARSDAEVRYEVELVAQGLVGVSLSVPGVPGRAGFLLRGRAEGGALVEVWVEV